MLMTTSRMFLVRQRDRGCGTRMAPSPVGVTLPTASLLLDRVPRCLLRMTVGGRHQQLIYVSQSSLSLFYGVRCSIPGGCCLLYGPSRGPPRLFGLLYASLDLQHRCAQLRFSAKHAALLPVWSDVVPEVSCGRKLCATYLTPISIRGDSFEATGKPNLSCEARAGCRAPIYRQTWALHSCQVMTRMWIRTASNMPLEAEDARMRELELRAGPAVCEHFDISLRIRTAKPYRKPTSPLGGDIWVLKYSCPAARNAVLVGGL